MSTRIIKKNKKEKKQMEGITNYWRQRAALARSASKIVMWSAQVEEAGGVDVAYRPFLQLIGQMAELVEYAYFNFVKKAATRDSIVFLHTHVEGRRDLLRFLDGQNYASFDELWRYFKNANRAAVLSVAEAHGFSERQLDQIISQIYSESRMAVVHTFQAFEALQAPQPTQTAASVAQDKRKKSATTLRKWTRAAKQHGYMRSGEKFKPLPRKGTKAHRAIYKTFQAMK